MKLKEKNMFITGANRGMGRAFARKAAELGAHVHVVNRSTGSGIVDELHKLGAASAREWQLDMGDTEAIKKFVTDVENENINIDVLINNAGLLTGGLLETQSPDAIIKMLNVNLTGLITLTRLVLPGMLKRNTGKIVNNASVSGIMFWPCASTYAASKAGVVAFTKSLEQELKDTGVSTLVLFTPGVKTDMYDQISDDYGQNLDLSFMEHISADEWTEQVFACIENNSSECVPRGSARQGLFVARHFPGIFYNWISGRFNR